MRRVDNIKTSFVTVCRRWLLAVAAVAALFPAAVQARQKVIIACDWDFAPYEFINSHGKSDGYNVEVLHRILTELNIPHEFVMKARRQNVAAFRQRTVDLIVDFRDRWVEEQYSRTSSVFGYYQIMLAHRNDVTPVTDVTELRGKGPVILNSANDSVARTVLGDLAEGLELVFQSPREALGNISAGNFKYLIWGEETLKWRIKEYNLKNVVLTKLDLPSSEIRVVGYDKQLIDDIDSQFARMMQSGEISKIRNKWFHSAVGEEHTSPIVIYIALAVILFTIFVMVLYRLARVRVKAAMNRNADMEAMMHQALSMGNFSVMINDLRHNRVTNEHGNALPEWGVTGEELLARIHPDDREAMMGRSQGPESRKGQARPYTMRWNNGTPEKPKWINVTGYSYPEFDEHGRPENIVITSHDISADMRNRTKEEEMGSRYHKMFDSSLIAMSFYDKDFRLIDLNTKMKELCGLTDENIEYFKSAPLTDFDMLSDFDPHSLQTFHVCQHMYYPELGIDKYIEVRVRPTTDDNGEVLYYIITARDVTSDREMYKDLRRQDKALMEATKTNSTYEMEMRALLSNCNMYVWHTDMESGIISFSRSLHSHEFSETLEEYVNGMYEDDRKTAIENIHNIQSFSRTFNVVHRFHHTPVTNGPAWFAVSGIPITDADGKVKKLFGIVRDVTTLMEAQEQLKEETARAENSAMLKSTFLANMTHEIRTPLNAIVGFSDLLQMVSEPEERKEFIRIIRNNCDMLLRLINDIFEASTMDVKPLKIEPVDVDFAAEFNVVCQSLRQRVQEPGVEFIVDNPYTSFLTRLDMGRMQQVITNFVTNAVKYTHSGHIRVGYKYITEDELSTLNVQRSTSNVQRPTGIYMYCEDTGAGIPKEQQKKVFDRFVKLNDFVQGTGLGLSICKSIAERSEGHIGVESDGDGKGSTFWIWVPCQCSTSNVQRST